MDDAIDTIDLARYWRLTRYRREDGSTYNKLEHLAVGIVDYPVQVAPGVVLYDRPESIRPTIKWAVASYLAGE
jgi:hypothetical protein